jgi:hypothetical protein
VADEMEVVSFGEHFTDEETLAAALADFDTVFTLRERRRSTRCSVLRRRRGTVPFPASLSARLPRLKLLIASGMRNT